MVHISADSPSAQSNEVPNGVYAAALTPMHPDLSCNHKKLASHCMDLMQRGCAGIALFGTTGEGPSFSISERKEALKKLIFEGVDPKKIILGNGSTGIQDTIELAQEALKQGCLAMLIAPPSFYKNISDDGVLSFYREIIHRIDDSHLRIILYHIPQFSGVPISLNVISTLHREFPNTVIGIKESEGDLSFTKRILKTVPGFQVFVGNEKQIIEAVYLGAAGSICGIANLYPELICSLYEAGQSGNSPNPANLEAIFQALSGLPFIPAAKSVMEKRQNDAWHTIRPTLVPLDAARSRSFISALQKRGLEK